MSEDIVSIELEFENAKQCKKVKDIFYNLRAKNRGEAEWPSNEQLIEKVGAISEKAKELLLTPLKGTEEEKTWLLKEIKPNKVDGFEFQWRFMDMEGAWVESLEIVHIFEPDDFPEKIGKNGTKIRISWMWNRSYLITAAMMIKMFKELGVVKIKSKVYSDYGC